jgi:hypothetical protein
MSDMQEKDQELQRLSKLVEKQKAEIMKLTSENNKLKIEIGKILYALKG